MVLVVLFVTHVQPRRGFYDGITFDGRYARNGHRGLLGRADLVHAQFSKHLQLLSVLHILRSAHCGRNAVAWHGVNDAGLDIFVLLVTHVWVVQFALHLLRSRYHRFFGVKLQVWLFASWHAPILKDVARLRLFACLRSISVTVQLQYSILNAIE